MFIIPGLDDATNQFVGKITKYSTTIRNNESHLIKLKLRLHNTF